MRQNAGAFFSADGNMNPAGGPYNSVVPFGRGGVNAGDRGSTGGGGTNSNIAGPLTTTRIPPTSEIARGSQPNYAPEIRPIDGVKKVDEGSDMPVHYHLAAKPWDDRYDSLTKGTFDDLTTELPHHLQLQMGDLGFTARMVNNNLKDQILVNIAELAKLNEVLAIEGIKMKRDTLERPLVKMDGHQQRYTNGEFSDATLKSVYPKDISRKKIWHLMADLYWMNALLHEGKEPPHPSILPSKSHLFYPSEYSLVKYRTWKEAGGRDHSSDGPPKDDRDMSSEDWVRNYNVETNDSLWEPEYTYKETDANRLQPLDAFRSRLCNNVKGQHDISPGDLELLSIHFRALHYALVEILATNNNYFNHCTRTGIVSNWNFFGVVNNDGGDGTLPTGGRPKSMASEINFVVRRISQVVNRWGPHLIAGTSLFVILKRYGSENLFQLVPHFDWEGGEPAWEDRVYMDLDGTEKEGHVYPIGVVYYDYKDKISDEDREIANGLARKGNPINFSIALERKINIAKEHKMVIQVRE